MNKFLIPGMDSKLLAKPPSSKFLQLSFPNGGGFSSPPTLPIFSRNKALQRVSRKLDFFSYPSAAAPLMLLRNRAQGTAGSLRKLPFLTRPLSQSAALAATQQEIFEAPLDYLEGFPRPDPKDDETIIAIPRLKSGKIIAGKERKEWRVPAIVFEQEDGQRGGNKRLISVHSKQIRKLVNHVGYHFFLSRLFNLEVRSEFEDSAEIIEKVRVLPRLLHLHAGTDAPLNVTFMRAPSQALLKIDVPLVFRGDDACPGLRKGGRLNTIKRTMKYLCPADIVPPYIDVDLSELEAGQKLLARDLQVHPALKLLRSPDEPICNIIGARVSEQRKSK